jgi:hypothetical protein
MVNKAEPGQLAGMLPAEKRSGGGLCGVFEANPPQLILMWLTRTTPVADAMSKNDLKPERRSLTNFYCFSCRWASLQRSGQWLAAAHIPTLAAFYNMSWCPGWYTSADGEHARVQDSRQLLRWAPQTTPNWPTSLENDNG